MEKQTAYTRQTTTRLPEAIPALSMLSIGVGLLVITTGHSVEGFCAVVLGFGIGLGFPIYRLLVQSTVAAMRKTDRR